MLKSGIDKKVINNLFDKYSMLLPAWMKFVDNSFLPEKYRKDYKQLLVKKGRQLGLG